MTANGPATANNPEGNKAIVDTLALGFFFHVEKHHEGWSLNAFSQWSREVKGSLLLWDLKDQRLGKDKKESKGTHFSV